MNHPQAKISLQKIADLESNIPADQSVTFLVSKYHVSANGALKAQSRQRSCGIFLKHWIILKYLIEQKERTCFFLWMGTTLDWNCNLHNTYVIPYIYGLSVLVSLTTLMYGKYVMEKSRIINEAWVQSFAHIESNKKDIAEIGWYLYNRALMTIP